MTVVADKSTREQIVDAADQLFYKRGFEATSFADIAKVVNISRGNFYHHFKTKDEILDAVIAARVGQTRGMLAQWEACGPDPMSRIRSFIHILVANQALIMRHGCPVGTLSTELAKLDHPSLKQASGLFTLFRVWLRKQFALLGRKADADALAMHLLARSQGVAVLANAFHDKSFVKQEVRQLCEWLESCAPKPAASNR
ncbi:TetR/AcrR family transcriptional regulator [Variovorax paradoxus]|jgi:AcrR family transcriptional regulator|uniref:TetR/AcrR family transcriptional regulator n=1 Tax=Variovorax paradoxus TaxID=34073 RepID=UPI0024807815|nr:TetR/AcrR family transcriptional regulator [Variovorax paradoxus]WGT66499.1 TetR/AcrR family transcriptional regulator [Variovorax paradoxus]